jgi:hypothetical protein
MSAAEPEPVGTLAEEAAKLFAAIQSWAADREPAAATRRSEDEEPGPVQPDPLQPDAEDVDDPQRTHRHPDPEPGSTECRWCPHCQLVRMAKATSPDVREHLSQAALSLALALKGLLEEPERTARRAAPVEKIDLTEE